MTWEELTDEQRAVLSDYVRNLRSWAGEQARTNNHSDALNTAYTAGITTTLGLLGSTEEIHDGSGLGGAMTLTQASGRIDIFLTDELTALRRGRCMRGAD